MKPKTQLLTVNGLAETTGIDRRTIRKRLVAASKDPAAKHTLASVIDVLKPPVEDSSPIKDQTEFQRWRKLKLANDRAEKLMVERAAVVAWFGALASRQKKILRQRLENELPAAMAGVDPGSGRVIAKRVTDEICAEMVRAIEGLEKV